ncbi:MAG: proline--tRNA ligase [Gammaproteobacteria bacterium]|nr:proline--tRNA ligase [Gammaproteobacteria bacterium]
MRATHWLLTTLKETPSEAEIVSHQLMLRAGLIKKLGSGLYSWMPVGLKILRKVEQIVREEMNKTGALELLMPAVQPAELWQETGRWDTFGGQLLTMTDHQKRDYCFGPTHEEVITDIVRSTFSSYQSLPISLYQIQSKFRDEIRPRFGVMRAREFLMKDAYSFHLDSASLQTTYDAMYQAYSNIFQRLGLTFRAVEADTGAIGGSYSHEFQVMAQAGEDLIFYSTESQYAANVEKASSLAPAPASTAPSELMERVHTPDLKSIEDVSAALHIQPHTMLKTLLVKGREVPIVALVLAGNDTLNPIKAAKHPLVHDPLIMASESEVQLPIGYVGPLHLSIPVIADHVAASLDSFVCGANEKDYHVQHAAWHRDASYTEVADLRTVQEGDISPDGKGILKSCRGIEVGHVFQLGDKYTKAMQLTLTNPEGKPQYPLMGTYGLGISRVVAAAIEQHHDAKGICWPVAMAPFELVIIPIDYSKNEAVQALANSLYQWALDANIDVLLDDREERPGVKFADSDLIGIPHRIVIGPKHLQNDQIEYKARVASEPELMSVEAVKKMLEGRCRVDKGA